MTKAIVIGGSPSVLEAEMGDVINKFDKVIRCNNFVTAGFEKYVGSKMDVWVVNSSRSTKRREGKIFSEVWYKEQPRYKLLPKIDGLKGCERSKLQDPKQWAIRDFDGLNPSIGFRAIMHAMSKFDEVHAFGFTFFTEGDGKLYDHYYTDHGLNDYYRRYYVNGNWAKDEQERSLIQEALEQGKSVVRGDYHSGQLEKEVAVRLFEEGKLGLLNPAELGL